MARCPACGCRFQTLEDEEGMHDCPRCGYGREDDCPYCGGYHKDAEAADDCRQDHAPADDQDESEAPE